MARGNETILIVEDDEQVRRMAARILTSAGFKVLVAASGGEAIIACEQEEAPIHLLVTDVIMPGLNGRELAGRLIALRPALKVVFMSGYNDDSIARLGVLDASVRFVGKPFSPTELTNAIRDALDDR